jgi:hypothetical protein
MIELPRGTTGRVPSINYDLHMHAADSQDRGKLEQAKAKTMPFKRVKRIEFLKGHQGTDICITAALGNQRQGVV